MSAEQNIVKALRSASQTLALAESCTGGKIADRITAVPGSSAVFWGDIVSYSNEAKIKLLNVGVQTLEREGAVSAGVAGAMAAGMQTQSGTDWTAAVTGIAGPGGGTPEKPVGTVWIAWCGPDGNTEAVRFLFSGNREDIRRQSADAVLNGILDRLKIS